MRGAAQAMPHVASRRLHGLAYAPDRTPLSGAADTMSATTYSIPDTVLAAHLEGEAVLLDMNSKHYFRLNDTGAFIWQELERRQPIDTIVDGLCDTFVVERD